MENRNYNLAQLVVKINGDFYPVGESQKDTESLENLEQMGDMINEFVSEIYNVWATNHAHYEGSRIDAAKKAGSILLSLDDYMPRNNPALLSYIKRHKTPKGE